jgi:hypothetical protein
VQFPHASRKSSHQDASTIDSRRASVKSVSIAHNARVRLPTSANSLRFFRFIFSNHLGRLQQGPMERSKASSLERKNMKLAKQFDAKSSFDRKAFHKSESITTGDKGRDCGAKEASN